MSMTVNPPTENDTGIVPIEYLKKPQECLCPALYPTSSHHILFRLPDDAGINSPTKNKPNPEWNPNYAVLPHYKNNRIKNREGKLISRWPLIQSALQTPIEDSHQLEQAIFKYSGLPNEHCKEYKFLHKFFNEVLDKPDSDYFFGSLLPQIIALALKIEELFSEPIPLLKRNTSLSISMTQKQIASIMANSFLCTFPFHHPSTLPSINCAKLFQIGRSGAQKLKCIINYFRRILSSTADGVVTYSRRHLCYNKLPNWSASPKTLKNLYISENGSIEVEGKGLLEIDFANCYIGGGVLGWGCVQEEIKFLMFPEMIASRLFTEFLDNTEAVILTGCEQFNKYSGYASTFQWTGDYIDRTPKDKYGRRCSITVAIDALNFSVSNEQYKPNHIARELNKAFAGFSFGLEEGYTTPIATGNWGCGVYNGDPLLKGLIQLIAAAECGRDMAYFTFGEEGVKNDILSLYTFLRKNKVKICDLWALLQRFSEFTSQIGPLSVNDYIFNCINKGIDAFLQLDQDKDATTSTSSPASPVSNGTKETEAADNNGALIGDDEDTNLSDTDMNESNCMDLSKSGEPVKASTYSLSDPEGREKLRATEEQQWAACSSMKARVSLAASEEPPKKKTKITDYLFKLSKK